MQPHEAKRIIKELGLTGVRFSALMGKNKNYVTDFNRYGVPGNVAIILILCKTLLAHNMHPIRIVELIVSQVEPVIVRSPAEEAELQELLARNRR